MTDGIDHMNTFLLNQAAAAQQSGEAKAQAGNKAETKQACRGFESVFVNYLMQQMRKTIPPDGFVGGGQAEKIYTGMLDGQVAKTISEQRGIGLAKIMYEQMTAENSPQRIKK